MPTGKKGICIIDGDYKGKETPQTTDIELLQKLIKKKDQRRDNWYI